MKNSGYMLFTYGPQISEVLALTLLLQLRYDGIKDAQNPCRLCFCRHRSEECESSRMRGICREASNLFINSRIT